MLEKFIHFFIEHNERIILVTLSLFCLVGGGYAIYRFFFGPKQTAEGFDFSQIEESLKRILAQTNSAIATTGQQVAAQAAGAAPSAATGGASTAELENLKKELESRSKLISQLQSQVDAAKANDGTPELLSKIKNLEGKLAEYEIIEDDIADLSHFKEENAKLKKEIETLKLGGATLVDEFAATVAEGGASSAAPAAKAAPAGVVGVATDAAAMSGMAATSTKSAAATNLDDAIASVQAGMELDIAPPDEVTPMAEPAAPAAAPAPAAASAPVAAKPEAGAGDIFAEFSGENSDPLADLGELDTDRMLEELQGLEAEMGDASALEEATDMDKMASEATNLKKG